MKFTPFSVAESANTPRRIITVLLVTSLLNSLKR